MHNGPACSTMMSIHMEHLDLLYSSLILKIIGIYLMFCFDSNIYYNLFYIRVILNCNSQLSKLTIMSSGQSRAKRAPPAIAEKVSKDEVPKAQEPVIDSSLSKQAPVVDPGIDVIFPRPRNGKLIEIAKPEPAAPKIESQVEGKEVKPKDVPEIVPKQPAAAAAPDQEDSAVFPDEQPARGEFGAVDQEESAPKSNKKESPKVNSDVATAFGGDQKGSCTLNWFEMKRSGPESDPEFSFQVYMLDRETIFLNLF